MRYFVTAMLLVFCCFMMFQISSCTQQDRVKMFGGTGNIDLPQGKKLVMVTWKETNLWLLLKPMNPHDVAESYEFVESSSWGLVEGKLIIKEHK